MISATACGKLILCGEHAVVYNQEAVAIPLSSIRAQASIKKTPGSSTIQAPDIGLSLPLAAPTQAHPLQTTVWHAQEFFQITLPEYSLIIESELPIGCGLGSGAAISAAIFRLFAVCAKKVTTLDEECGFIHEIEKLYHGEPSGVDGEVIARERAILFSKAHSSRPFDLPAGLSLVLCNSGPAKPTHEVVSQVRHNTRQAPQKYDQIFHEIGQISTQAYQALLKGDLKLLGELLNQNHTLLKTIGVSSPRLDRLVELAQKKGALGAKLSGAGQGGICFALCQEEKIPELINTWKKANARWIKVCRF